jgi:hypothetical protein
MNSINRLALKDRRMPGRRGITLMPKVHGGIRYQTYAIRALSLGVRDVP